ncbi:four helix bundle protein [Candidatus Omnitrophota bacterium]
MIKSYKDLDVWKKSIELVKVIYKITSNFPKEEQFGLVSQMRRSAVSIPSNIAEGKTRQHKNEYIQFLYIALGSSSELNTQAIIANELNFIKSQSIDVLLDDIDHVSRMLHNLIGSLKRKP